MPELPEVEITRRKLAPSLVDRRIASVETTAPSYFFLTAPEVLRRRLPGARVHGLRRLGKYLVADLSGGARLLLHLGMTGQLFAAGHSSVALLRSTGQGTLGPAVQPAFAPDKHTHLVLGLSDGGQVFFRDPRKFGKVQWLAKGAPSERLDKLGPDALGAEGAHLYRASRGRKGSIKGLLLNQSVLAGVGNIYADEALFRARIRPGRAAGRVSRAECDALAEALRAVMELSIATGGSSISDYVHPDGERGRYQDTRAVYARAGQACGVCGGAIRHRTIAQRSSHYCPTCQR